MMHLLASHRMWHRPHSASITILRLVIGGIWLAGAAWNALVTWHMTDPFGWLAHDAGLPPWRWFFSEVVGSQPRLWIALLIAGEITLGLLTLGRGRWAQIGLAGGALFSIVLVSFGTPYTLVMVPWALLLISLARQDARHSVRDRLPDRHRGVSAESAG